MEALVKDFFRAWEEEIAAYQEVSLCLEDQKISLIEWNIKKFQNVMLILHKLIFHINPVRLRLQQKY